MSILFKMMHKKEFYRGIAINNKEKDRKKIGSEKKVGYSNKALAKAAFTRQRFL